MSKISAFYISLRAMSTSKPKPNPAKAELRKDVDKRIAAMTSEDRAQQSKIIFQKILSHPKYQSSKRIAVFLSLPTEVDTAPILADILERGGTPFVPQYGMGKMRMLRVLRGDVEKMPLTSWRIPQHTALEEREEATESGGLDLVIAPGAAFTKDGWRLGHGGGYYDRYLTSLLELSRQQPSEVTQPYLLAVGFKQQIYDAIVTDPNDVRLDEIITAQ